MAATRDPTTTVAVVIMAFGLAVVGLFFFFVWVESSSIDLTHLRMTPTVIKSVDWDENTGQMEVHVEYMGDETVTLVEVYVNGTLDPEASITPRVLSTGQTAKIILSKTYVNEPTQISIRIITSDGRDAFTEKTLFCITLEHVAWDDRTGKIKVAVKNIGYETITLSEVYVNGTLDDAAIPNPIVLSKDNTAEVTLSGTYTDTHTHIPIEVTTLEGASDEKSAPIHGIWIQSINWNRNTGEILAYVYGNGYEDVTVSSVYVNGTLDSAATIWPHSTTDFWTITLSETFVNNPSPLTLKVVTADGAFAELTSQHPHEFG